MSEELKSYSIDTILNEENEQEIEEIFSIMQNLIKVLPTYSGKLNNKEILFERFTKYEKDTIKMYKLAHFISHSLNVDSNLKYLFEHKKSKLYILILSLCM